MPKALSSIWKALASRARRLDLYLRRMEALHSQGDICAKDVERAYAGGVLEFYAYLEQSIEKAFLGLLLGRLASSGQVIRPLVTVKADAVARALISGARPYVNWLPYKRHTSQRAASFFSQGKPFTRLGKGPTEALEDIAIVRNALAHQSSSAKRAFEKRFIEGRNIPPSQRRPAAFLRGPHTYGQTRMNYLLSGATSAMRTLCR